MDGISKIKIQDKTKTESVLNMKIPKPGTKQKSKCEFILKQ